MSNTYKCSNGERISKLQIDKNIRKAKELKLKQQYDEYNYNFCSVCHRNDDLPLDCSHTESVDSCQKNGYAEKAWDIDNIEIVGRKCHQKHDNNDVRTAKIN